MGSFPTATAGPSQPLPKLVVRITAKWLEIVEKYKQKAYGFNGGDRLLRTIMGDVEQPDQYGDDLVV